MKPYICQTCGVQYAASEKEPERCEICTDDRQYVPRSGQKWTTLEELKKGNYTNQFTEVEPGLYSIHTVPQVGIGQNAYLVTTPEGNILWDCITYIDDETIQKINELGGLKAIALSHPHYYSTITVWADAFNCPIYIHEKDKEWTTIASSSYHFWSGEELELLPGCKLINLGGHFDGSAVLLWEQGSSQRGTLLVGDTIFIVPDPGWVSFLYSHPNRIPLPAFEVRKIKGMIENYEFYTLYGAFGNSIPDNGKEAVLKSADRYLYHVERTEI